MAKVIASVVEINGQFVPNVHGRSCPTSFATRHAANKALNSAMRSASWKAWQPHAPEDADAPAPAASTAPVARTPGAVMSEEEAASYADIDWAD